VGEDILPCVTDSRESRVESTRVRVNVQCIAVYYQARLVSEGTGALAQHAMGRRDIEGWWCVGGEWLKIPSAWAGGRGSVN
jgi:hypothetical protein